MLKFLGRRWLALTDISHVSSRVFLQPGPTTDLPGGDSPDEEYQRPEVPVLSIRQPVPVMPPPPSLRLVAHAASAGAMAFLAPISLGNAEASVELAVHNQQRRFKETQELLVARLHSQGKDLLRPQVTHVEAAGRLGVGYVVASRAGAYSSTDERALTMLMLLRPANIWLSFAAGSSSITRPIQLLQEIISDEQMDTRIFAQVHTAEDAVRAVSAGCDVLVLRGAMARGPSFYGGNSRESLTELFPAVAMRIERQLSLKMNELKELSSSLETSNGRLVAPFILASGGIRTGGHLRWALTMGFDGVVMGSRFELCDESGIPLCDREREKQRLTGSSTRFPVDRS